MALDREEMERRRQERELRRTQQKQEQRKLILKLCIAAAVILACIVGIVLIAGSGSGDATPPASQPADSQPQDTQPQDTQAATKPTEQTSIFNRPATTVIHIRAAGDLNITDAVVNSGLTTNGYDYTAAFQDVVPVLSDADLTLMNFEGNLCGLPYGSQSTSAPQELPEALRAAGVDILQMANSCSLNNGLLGLQSTLSAIRAAGMEPTGAYATPEEFRRSQGYTICNVQGIKVAVVAFTKGVGSRGLPTGSEDCVNLLYTDYASTYQDVDTDFINQVLKAASAEDPDLIIAMLHWGSEFNDSTAASQNRIVNLLRKRGVDVIIGTHPHLVQPIDYNKETGEFIAWSLGDFYGDGEKGGTNYSIVLDLEVTMDNDSGKTRVTGYSYIPIYTLKEKECDGQRRVVRIHEAMAAYDSNYVDRITSAAYTSMQTALERIADRLTTDWECSCQFVNKVNPDQCDRCGNARVSK